MIYYYRIFVKHKIQWSAIKGDYSKFMSKNIELGLGKIQSVFIIIIILFFFRVDRFMQKIFENIIYTSFN